MCAITASLGLLYHRRHRASLGLLCHGGHRCHMWVGPLVISLLCRFVWNAVIPWKLGGGFQVRSCLGSLCIESDVHGIFSNKSLRPLRLSSRWMLLIVLTFLSHHANQELASQFSLLDSSDLWVNYLLFWPHLLPSVPSVFFHQACGALTSC